MPQKVSTCADKDADEVHNWMINDDYCNMRTIDWAVNRLGESKSDMMQLYVKSHMSDWRCNAIPKEARWENEKRIDSFNGGVMRGGKKQRRDVV